MSQPLSRLSITSCILWATLSLCFSNTNLTNELQVVTNQKYSDHTLTEAQYQYITNHLENEPNCAELLKILQPFTQIEYESILEEYCPLPTPPSQAKPLKVHLKGRLSQTIYPKEKATPPYRLDLKGGTSHIGFDLEYYSIAHKLKKRNLKGHIKNQHFQMGNWTPPKELSFMTGRGFWEGHQSQGDSTGFLFSQKNQFNGLLFSHQKPHQKNILYTSLNPTLKNKQPYTIYTGGYFGLKKLYGFQYMTHQHGSYFQLPDGSTLQHLNSGFSFKEDKQQIQISTGFSWNSLHKKIGAYGEVNFKPLKSGITLKFYQANKYWTSLLSSSFRKKDSLAGLISYGANEGGWDIQSITPLFLYKGKTLSKLKLTSKNSWDNNQNLYLKWQATLQTKKKPIHHSVFVKYEKGLNSAYTSLGQRLALLRKGKRVELIHSHKVKSYRGNSPHPLALSYKQMVLKKSDVKIKWSTYNLIQIFDKHYFLIQQNWALQGRLGVTSSIKLPFTGKQISDGLYYTLQTKFQW